MSLRIYIKGNNKLGSPNKTSASASQLPQFNQLPPSRMPKPSKKVIQRDSSKDSSAILESLPQENEYAFRSFGENSQSTPALTQKLGAGLQQNDRYFENSRDYKNDAENYILPRSKHEIQKDKQAFAKKMLNRTSLSDKQLRSTVQECYNIIMALFEEVEKLHDLYSQKSKEVEVFRDLDNSFNLNRTTKIKSDLDKSAEFENEKSDNTRLKKENVRLIEMVRRLTDSNTELNEETSILREMASSSEQTLQRERESFKALRDQAEALVIMNDEINARLDEKENDVTQLNASLQESLQKTQQLMFELRAKDQALEEYKQSAFSGQVQASFRNSATYAGETLGRAQKSESLKSSAVHGSDWQNKFETSKAENAKLLKIIEGNQQVIKDLKQTLSNLETRSAQRFEEVKSLYENKIKSMSSGGKQQQQDASQNKIPPPFSYPSSYHHSQKPSYDQSALKGLGQMY